MSVAWGLRFLRAGWLLLPKGLSSDVSWRGMRTLESSKIAIDSDVTSVLAWSKLLLDLDEEALVFEKRTLAVDAVGAVSFFLGVLTGVSKLPAPTEFLASSLERSLGDWRRTGCFEALGPGEGVRWRGVVLPSFAILLDLREGSGDSRGCVYLAPWSGVGGVLRGKGGGVVAIANVFSKENEPFRKFLLSVNCKQASKIFDSFWCTRGVSRIYINPLASTSFKSPYVIYIFGIFWPIFFPFYFPIFQNFPVAFSLPLSLSKDKIAVDNGEYLLSLLLCRFFIIFSMMMMFEGKSWEIDDGEWMVDGGGDCYCYYCCCFFGLFGLFVVPTPCLLLFHFLPTAS